jgi:putative tricarboxylic transport membrane protein
VKAQVAVGLVVTGIGGLVLWGARSISGEAGYGGVGPNFLPNLVGWALLIGGVGLLIAAWRGRWFENDLEAAEAVAEPADASGWLGFAWMSAGLLANAILIERIGFVLACVLCFVLAVRGLRLSKGVSDRGVHTWLRDAAVGFAIAAPVYWMFGKLLGISLPGLTGTGWL